MKSFSHRIEFLFEKLVSKAVSILGNSYTFIAALIFVIYWLCDKDFYMQSRHAIMTDLIYAITFLSFFIIQKSVNHFSKVMQIKLNELVTAHEGARTQLVNVENKTEQELAELVKDYSKIAEQEVNSNTNNKDKQNTK